MFDRVISVKIELSKDECYQSIQDFYDLVAEKLGYNPEQSQYDCTKICVSKPVKDQIFAYYKNENQLLDEEIGQRWLLFGPKANLPEELYIAEVQRGFVECNNHDRLPFTEEQFIRTMTNLHIVSKYITRPDHYVTDEDKNRLYDCIEEACDISYQLHDNFFSQFRHNPRARRVCPNDACKKIYAYFYEDFIFCPKCGTKLIGNGPGMEN